MDIYIEPTPPARPSFYARWGKRALDLGLTLGALTVLAPVAAVVAGAVRARMGSPVLFKQRRVGLHGTPFTIFKFRTMTDARDRFGRVLSDDERLTSFGKWLRKTSLDELPQLLNVLRGDMSVIGPRPLLPHYTPWFTERERTRLDVRPGITGWAQVNGRNALDWDRRLGLDAMYVEKLSFSFDLRILFATVGTVLGRGAVQSDPTELDEERAKAWGKDHRSAA